MENPNKIEIEGLKTIHKLCNFGAEHDMEGCSFTEIVERMFSKIKSMQTQVNTLDEMLLNQGDALAEAKAQAVPEGFVLVSKEMPKSFDEGLYVYSNSISIVDECSEGFIPMSDINHAEVWKLVIEGLEYTITELSIDWGMECPICNHNEATCYSTATQESGYEFMDGDAVVCLKCGNKGEMDADGENSDIAWDEAQEQSHD